MELIADLVLFVMVSLVVLIWILLSGRGVT